MDRKIEMLCTLLDCKEKDLAIFDNCKMNFSELLDSFMYEIGVDTMSEVISAIHILGVNEVEQSIRNIQDDLFAKHILGVATKFESKMMHDLESLSPVSDLVINADGANSYCTINDNAQIYKKYLKEELGRYSKLTGFKILTEKGSVLFRP